MLFRQEAISHQQERLTGAIVLAQPLSLKLVVILLSLIAASIIIFLFTAEYSRKETVRGFLQPNKGIIKSFARQGGMVEQLWVTEGQQVEQGQALASIIIPQTNQHGIELSTQLNVELNQQIALLSDEVNQHKLLRQQEALTLTERQQALQQEQQALKQQLELANDKLALLNKQHSQLHQLNNQGYVSTIEAERQQQALLDAKQEQQNISRLLLQQKNQLAQIKLSQQNLPQQYALRINNLKRQQADLKRQLAQINNNYRYTLTASHSGTITSIQVVAGETVSQNRPLLQILPLGAELVAELLLPTRSAGFVKQGDIAKLRFDAFPYQRFGFINSDITRIDQALIHPNEALLPIALQEPVYRLQAQLNQQSINAYGKHFELKSGMLFEADIILEKRSLIAWLFEPILSLKGRIS
ncbi:HlyD family efflux transporter periplasmic adaptor subunit [Endozoicomonas sp. G2_1]|uniref:HlyD family secretion protein n=1 Tax=Endozoicomonas sp. G2_1 TaxID=2821091 RepID=UPI001ADD43A2|nr:HlyD family efflux transporter periplasmic adaptor subunit [Endozoicomonas sp. G2_1]MBO9492305.1 HlyD family efflux transporter periplasmic adaptor subunit [Endozoicomonas sp. G2_1]